MGNNWSIEQTTEQGCCVILQDIQFCNIIGIYFLRYMPKTNYCVCTWLCWTWKLPKESFPFYVFRYLKIPANTRITFGTYHDILLNEPLYCYILQAIVQLNHKFNVKRIVDEFYRATLVCAVSFSLPFPINFLRVVNWKMLQRKEK